MIFGKKPVHILAAVASTIAAELVQVEAHDGVASSLLELQMGTKQRLRRPEAEAQSRAHEAEDAWKKSRAATDAQLAKVRTEMTTLNEDLKKTAEKQKQDLKLLEKSRADEAVALKNTEKTLRQLQESAKIEVPLPSSFLEDPSQADFLAPLRKAAADAKAFAEKIRKDAAERSSGSSSFLEGEEDYASKAERSLAMARQALSKLDGDLASQKRELEAQLNKAQKDEEALREGASSVGSPSFLQTGVEYDPLSPQALAEWREKFNAQLQRAREAAGITTPFKSSLVQLDNSAMDEKLKEDEQKVARLQDAFNTQMAKLKEDNAALLAEAQSQIEKAKNMKTKLEADLRSSSFLQGSEHNKFNAEAEKEKIVALQRKWQAEAAQLSAPSQPSESEKQLTNLIEEQKTKQATAQAELERLKTKLHKDIEALHKDMSMSAFATKPSFIESVGHEGDADIPMTLSENTVPTPSEESDEDNDKSPVSLLQSQDFMQAARDLIAKLTHFTAATQEVEPTNPIEAAVETSSSTVIDDADEVPLVLSKETKSQESTEVESSLQESKIDESAAKMIKEKTTEVISTEAKADEVHEGAMNSEEPKIEAVIGGEILAETASEEKAEEKQDETVAGSFVQLSTRDAADEALSRAEEGLKKLQQKLGQQSANLASYSVNI